MSKRNRRIVIALSVLVCLYTMFMLFIFFKTQEFEEAIYLTKIIVVLMGLILFLGCFSILNNVKLLKANKDNNDLDDDLIDSSMIEGVYSIDLGFGQVMSYLFGGVLSVVGVLVILDMLMNIRIEIFFTISIKIISSFVLFFIAINIFKDRYKKKLN